MTISKVKDVILKEITVLESGSLAYKGNVTEPHKSTLPATLHTGASRRSSQTVSSGISKSMCIFFALHFSGRCDVKKMI